MGILQEISVFLKSVPDAGVTHVLATYVLDEAVWRYTMIGSLGRSFDEVVPQQDVVL